MCLDLISTLIILSLIFNCSSIDISGDFFKIRFKRFLSVVKAGRLSSFNTLNSCVISLCLVSIVVIFFFDITIFFIFFGLFFAVSLIQIRFWHDQSYLIYLVLN